MSRRPPMMITIDTLFFSGHGGRKQGDCERQMRDTVHYIENLALEMPAGLEHPHSRLSSYEIAAVGFLSEQIFLELVTSSLALSSQATLAAILCFQLSEKFVSRCFANTGLCAGKFYDNFFENSIHKKMNRKNVTLLTVTIELELHSRLVVSDRMKRFSKRSLWTCQKKIS